MCPGLRILAVSRSDVESVRAGVSSMPADGVNLPLVIMLAEQPAVGTAPALALEPGGEAGTDRGVASPSGAPLHPIPLVRTPVACDLGVPEARHLTRGGEIPLALVGGRRGTHPAGVPSRPGPVVDLPSRGVGVSPAGPVAELHPRAMIPPTAGGVTHPGAVIIGPPAALGVELADHGRVGPCPTAAPDPPKRCQMRLDVGLGRCAQRGAPEPRVTAGSFPGVGGSHPLLPEVEPQQVQAGLSACHGGADVRCRHVQRQSARCPPGQAAGLAVC